LKLFQVTFYEVISGQGFSILLLQSKNLFILKNKYSINQALHSKKALFLNGAFLFIFNRNMTADVLIKSLALAPHPEGGYFRETYRSSETIKPAGLPARFKDERNFSTAIYFLIEKNNFSAFHRIHSDELWHFYEGDALEVVEINGKGELISTRLGRNIDQGEVFQYSVKAGNWFASRVLEGGEFSLVGCTVAPGFDFADFEMAKWEDLVKLFPRHEKIITELTRQ